MSIVSKFISAITGGEARKPAAAPTTGKGSPYAIPTVEFDPKRVTEAVKADLANNIRELKDFDQSHFSPIYDAALRSICRGRDVGGLAKAIVALDLPVMTKGRAGQISISLNNKATALMTRDQQVAIGAKYAVWVYSGAPCQTNPREPSAKGVRQDAAHKAADGKRYEVAKGMRLNGRLTLPGREEGCKCASRSIIPGFND
jgi:hypothetical protein